MSEATKTRIPANIGGLQASLKAKLANPDMGKETNTGDAAERDRKRRMKEMKDRQREAESSKEQLAEQLAAIQAELEEAKTGRSELEKKVAELEPNAKNWSDHEHKEKEILLAKLPPEHKPGAKELPLKQLRTFVKGIVPDGAVRTTTGEKLDRSKMTDDEMAKLAETNPEKFLELLDPPKTK